MAYYKIVECLHCRRYAITSATKVYICRFCGKSNPLSKLYGEKKIIFESDNYDDVVKYFEDISS